jgi:hypothetical protein
VRKAAAPKKLAAADQAIEDLYVDSDIGQVFTLNLGSEGEAASGGGEALQVYQAGEGEAEPAAVSESDGSVGSEEDAEEVEVQEPAAEPEEIAPDEAEEVEESAPVVEVAPEALAAPSTAKPQDPPKAPSSSPVDPPKPPPIG